MITHEHIATALRAIRQIAKAKDPQLPPSLVAKAKDLVVELEAVEPK